MAADAFLETLKARIRQANEAYAAQVEREDSDELFAAGEHWDPALKAQRLATGRPCLVIDLLTPQMKQVTNQQRTARPGIKISPVGKGADDEQAERWQGVIRRVERLSSAHRVYGWAGQHQVTRGRGFWRVRNLIVGDEGEQDVRVEEIEHQHAVLVDPACKKLDGSDKTWAVIFEDISHAEYVERFGESKLAEYVGEGWMSASGVDVVPEWVTSKHCRIAEYMYLKKTTRTRLVLRNADGDGERVWEDELPTTTGRVKGKFAKMPQVPAGWEVKKRVSVPQTAVHWCLVNGMGEKLEEATLPGELIPVVMIYGERRLLPDGTRDFRGMVRGAKDASRMEDFCESSLMEAIATAKTAPWRADAASIEGYESSWNTATTNPPAVLKFRSYDDSGRQLPAPDRVPSGVDVSAVTLAAQRMQNHVRSVTGNQDTYQEETGSQQAKLSGRAIQFRRQQQELGTSDYMENLGDGIVLTGKIIMGMARKVYDTPQLMRIIGADEKESEIVTHAGADQRAMAAQLQAGRKSVAGMLDVTLGEYDITISAIRSSPDTNREEASRAFESLPEDAQRVGADIYLDNLDFPGHKEYAKRLRKMNPAAQDDEKNPIPPQVQQQMQQAQALIDALTQQVTALREQVDDKEAEIASKERIANEDNATKLVIEREKIAADLELARIKGELELRKAEIAAAEAEKQRHEARLMVVHGAAHERGMEAERAEHERRTNGSGE